MSFPQTFSRALLTQCSRESEDKQNQTTDQHGPQHVLQHNKSSSTTSDTRAKIEAKPVGHEAMLCWEENTEAVPGTAQAALWWFLTIAAGENILKGAKCRPSLLIEVQFLTDVRKRFDTLGHVRHGIIVVRDAKLCGSKDTLKCQRSGTIEEERAFECDAA